jgi:hypothetical protein
VTVFSLMLAATMAAGGGSPRGAATIEARVATLASDLDLEMR